MKLSVDDFYKNLPDGRCKGCEYVKAIVATGQWIFLGCYHKTYKGKWVSEIRDCPKTK